MVWRIILTICAWLLLAAILGSVALFTILTGLLLNSKKMDKIYH
ncbi:MAG: hypothetical protein RQ743_05760 [Bacteroidales bacterium]|nr:hypothetical protein [Bacteroidales bacterium]